MSSFHLFPPPSPDVETKGSRILIRKGKKPSLGSSSSIPLEDLNGSNETDTGLRGISGDMRVQPPPKVHIKSNSETMLGPTPTPKLPSSWTLRSVNQQNDRASPSNVSSSTMLANNNCYAQIPRPAPVPGPGPGRSSTPDTDNDIPMRSIFPRYNPNIPLNQQHYYPQSQPQPQPQLSKLPPFRHKPKPPDLTLSPEPEIDRDLGPKTVPASVMDFPAGVRDSGEMEIRYSSVDELKRLWEVANGQRPEGLGEFNLRLSRWAYSCCPLCFGVANDSLEPTYLHSHSVTPITTPFTPSPRPQPQPTPCPSPAQTLQNHTPPSQ